jgi:hypothetical protein
MKKLYLTSFVVLTFLIIFDCSINKSPLEPGFSDKVRIIPSKGVDGVKFGDTVKDVVSLLGESDYGGHADGWDRSWVTKTYIKGKYAGLKVYFINKTGNDGPVDIFLMDSLYIGKTAEGIGLGSTVEEVKSAYGNPAKTQPSGSWLDYFYYFEDRKFELMTKDGVIKRMSLGYFIPM